MSTNGTFSEQHSLWMKFCGLSDDYEMLKDKWRFLQYELRPALPMIDHTFEKMDKLIEELDSLFKISRKEKERLDDIRTRFQGMTYSEYEDIFNKYETLNLYVARLKSAFVQRTLSLEIPEILTRLPQTPGREIGGEMFCIAADKVTKAYFNCLDIREIEWDGIVSFVPPVERSIVAVFTVGDLKLFHVCISEELRHYIATNILVAHELAHILTGKPRPVRKAFRDALEAEKILWKEFVKPIKDCKFCPWNPDTHDTSLSLLIFRELLTDIIGFKAAGMNFIHVLADIALWPGFEKEIIPRANGLLMFLRLSKMDEKQTDILDRRLRQYLTTLKASKLPFPKRCLKCWEVIGVTWGATIFNLESKLRLVSKLVKSEFAIDEKEEEVVRNNLKDGIIRTDIDPRKIIHVYYDLLRKGDYFNFAAVLHSLAYNTFDKK